MLNPTAVHLFDGIGGFPLGLQRAGWKSLWANDNNKYACQIHRKNFKEIELVERDIREVKPEEIPEATLLTAGSPCQSFSVAGKREGFNDIRGTMFFEVIRIVKAKRPKLLLLENVKGFLSAQEGYCFWAIKESLEELGYFVEWQVLNSKYFGVPQNRPRVFIVGHSREGGTTPIFPIGKDGAISFTKASDKPEGDQAGTLEASYGKSKSLGNHVKEIVGTLTGGAHSGGLHSQMTILSNSVRSGGRGSLDRHTWDIIQIKRTKADGTHLLRKYQGETPTLTSQMGTGGNNVPLVTEQETYRRLTEKECERLQGFPDDYTQGVSSSQRYRLLGNAVTVNVIEFLGRLLIHSVQHK